MPRATPAPTDRLHRHDPTGIERYAGTWLGRTTQHHAHPEYQITVTDAGCGRFEYRGGAARIPAGCLALFHPGEPHVLASDGDEAWGMRSLHIPARWLEADGPPLVQPAPLRLDPGLTQAVEGLWEDLAADRTAIGRSLAALAADLRGRPGVMPAPQPQSVAVLACLNHLAAVLDRPVGIAELARVAGAPAARIRRAFAAATGLPPQAWHLQRRIQEAKHRIAGGTGLADTALGLGFADQAHFTRHFTQLVGVSPARYARGIHGRD